MIKNKKTHKCNVCGKQYTNTGLYYETHIRKCVLRITNQYEKLIEAYEKDLNECIKITHKDLSFVDIILDLHELDLQVVRKLISHLLRFKYFNKNYSQFLPYYKYMPYLKIIKE